jgi:hypothetical protein
VSKSVHLKNVEIEKELFYKKEVITVTIASKLHAT